jgi:hypothetical protein
MMSLKPLYVPPVAATHKPSLVQTFLFWIVFRGSLYWCCTPNPLLYFTSTNFRSRTFCELAITVMSLQICIPSATLEAAQKEA